MCLLLVKNSDKNKLMVNGHEQKDVLRVQDLFV